MTAGTSAFSTSAPNSSTQTGRFRTASCPTSFIPLPQGIKSGLRQCSQRSRRCCGESARSSSQAPKPQPLEDLVLPEAQQLDLEDEGLIPADLGRLAPRPVGKFRRDDHETLL